MIEVIYKNGIMPNKLNFGCGTDIKQGYLNLDAKIREENYDCDFKDTWLMEGLLVSPHSLPHNHFFEIFSEMCFEHIHPDSIPNVLFCLYKSLVEGGSIKIIVPNFVQLANVLIHQETKKKKDLEYFDTLRSVTNEFMDPTYDDEGFVRGHQSIWTPSFAKRVLENEGFGHVKCEAFGPDFFYLKIIATKPIGNPYGHPTK